MSDKMENRNEPMSALEWCRVHHPERIYEWNLKKMEAYAQYRLSFQPAEVEEAIKAEANRLYKYDVEDSRDGDIEAMRDANLNEAFIRGAHFSATLTRPIDNSVEFAEWILNDYIESYCVSEKKTTTELYSIFINQKDKK